MNAIGRNCRSVCSIKNAKKRFPISVWLPKYNLDDLLGDSIAGLTVGLTTIPQAIAYGILAGLPPNYGLYSSFMGSFVYVIFGSCKDITVGPTAIMSILTADYCHGNPDIAVLMTFISSILILLCALLNLGFLISFVSKPVLSGFVSAAAITIASSQLKPLFGLKYKAENLIGTWVKFCQHIGETKWPDFVLGTCCIIVLLFLKKMREFKIFKPNNDDSLTSRAFKMSVFLISVGRNALVVIMSAIISAKLDDHQPFTITGDIKPGLPSFQIPPFSTNNGTTDFVGMVASTRSGFIIMPLLAVLESIAIGSSFSKGKTLDATQEMYALGFCNFFSSFFQAYPVTGSFSRTAVNATSGVRTPAGGIVTGTLVILSVTFLTPYFRFIPISALAAVIICAVIFMIEYQDIVPIWKVRKADQFVLWITFLLCAFYKLEHGIIIGVAVNLCILNYNYATPKVEVIPILELPNIPPHVIVEAHSGAQYVNIEHLRNKITKMALGVAQGIYPVIVDCYHFTHVDYSASHGMKSLNDDFRIRSQPLIFMNVNSGVRKGLKALNPDIQIIDKEDLLDILYTGRKKSCSITLNEDTDSCCENKKVDFMLTVKENESTSANLLNGVNKKEANVAI